MLDETKLLKKMKPHPDSLLDLEKLNETEHSEIDFISPINSSNN